MKQSPLIKICGLTNEADAFAAAQAGAHYLGYILYCPESPRAISLATANQIITHVRRIYPRVRHVGVFVDASREYIMRMQKQLELDVIQLHGTESVAEVTALADLASIWKSVLLRTAEDVAQIAHYEPHVDAIHVDAGRGSGEQIPPTVLQALRFKKPIILAGGITPNNVASMQQYAPAMIDVSSGVEIVRGKKDVHLIKQLIQNCYAATS